MDNFGRKLNHIWTELKEFRESFKSALKPTEEAIDRQTDKIVEQGKKTRAAIEKNKTEVVIDNKPVKDLHETIKTEGIKADVDFPETQAIEGTVELDDKTKQAISSAVNAGSAESASRS